MARSKADARPTRDNTTPNGIRPSIVGDGNTRSHVNGNNLRAPAGIARVGFRDRRRSFTPSRYARCAFSEAELGKLLWEALPRRFDSPIVDEYPDENTEAIYLVKPSNTRTVDASQKRILIASSEVICFEPSFTKQPLLPVKSEKKGLHPPSMAKRYQKTDSISL